MGGQTSTTQATQQQSSTQPWKPAQPYLQQGLPQIGAAISNSKVTPTEQSAFQQMFHNLSGLPNFGGAASNAAGNLLGIDNPNSTVNSAYNSMKGNYAPYTGQDYLNPYNNPAFQQYMDTIGNDIQNRTNSMFAGAGRDLSGANQNALARGITEGTAPVFANQYNQNVSAQQHAIDALFGGGISANQANSGNAITGAGLAGAVPTLANQNQQGILNTSMAQFADPLAKQSLAQSLLLPIAGLGSQSQGTGTTNTTQQTDPITQMLSAAALAASVYAKSDRNHKEIHGAGILSDGEYIFSYHGDDAVYSGRMAQDVEKTRPDAVIDMPLLGKHVTAEFAPVKVER